MNPLVPILLKVVAQSKKARKLVKAELRHVNGYVRWIDPPGCGCTDCIVSHTRPASDNDEYLLAKAVGCAR